jgi:catechol 2,3-dioxygenase-like lactoylglutathione lyase family enzyme
LGALSGAGVRLTEEEEMAGNTYQITPFMHVIDVDEAVRFLVDVLGFTAPVHDSGYAYLEREGAGLRVLGHGNDPEEIGTPHRGFAYYIDVRDLGIVLEQLAPKLAALPEGDVHGPVDQPYGQRELMIRAPDGNVLVFGQAIESASRPA